jgi:ferredoxin-fold anticodon binding domain-containing protein
MDINEILRQIRFGTFNNNELNTISEAIRFRRSMLTEEKKDDLFVGLNVKFSNSRNGRVYTGVVEKINRKFVIVRTQTQSWRVPMTMLEKV